MVYALIVNTGVLLFSDSDIYHADMWIKREGRLNVLPAFQEAWYMYFETNNTNLIS